MKLSQKLKDQLWWLIISVDYDYSRISIADHDLTDDMLTLWLEDKHDFKNSLDECLQLDVPHKYLAKIIRAENLNSYEGTKLHPTKKYVYKARVQINEALTWYRDDAAAIEQQWAREAVLRSILTRLIETETVGAADLTTAPTEQWAADIDIISNEIEAWNEQ
ncbi:hypothetical protein [Mucilaginibacter segetis]|uniref:Uncharacterized protein n=1 Tax=Mucilaginibacter segetis TaxID=2793071 RepID=A0A934ULI7_9SPHI|nr:hypothetical protein [Mucilaginibacter segetis]MBK0378608.1 hypothetical protein [Mucilaginibacter segetis]